MKQLVLIATIFFGGACPSLAADHEAEQQMLDSARRPADLFQGQGDPFAMEVDFTTQFKAPIQGHFSIKWGSKDHWWSKVEVGGFEQTTIKNGEMEYTSRNFPYTPSEVSSLFRLINFEGNTEELVAQKQKDRTENGIASVCVQAERKGYVMREIDETCLDAATHDLLSEEWQVQDQKKREQFADYVEFNGRRYPRKLQRLVNGSVIASASVISLQPAAFDLSLLTPPKGSIERRHCSGMVPPVNISRPLPHYSGWEKVAGVTTARFTVLTDGSVDNIQITHSGGQIVDQVNLAAMKKWKYKPAMCGTEPVVSDMWASQTYKAN